MGILDRYVEDLYVGHTNQLYIYFTPFSTTSKLQDCYFEPDF